MLEKITASTMLNLGSLATFLAFPLLYIAVFSENPVALAAGMLLMVFSMLTPFIARKCGKPGNTESK